jgi:hypothetical protein
LFEQIKDHISVSNLIRNLPALSGLAAIGLLLFFAGQYYRALFDLNGQSEVVCAQQVAALIPSADRIVVSSDSAAIIKGVANNYQDPVIFYASRHFGWSLAADQQTPDRLAQYHESGADYIVMTNSKEYYSNPALMSYITSNTTQVGGGIDSECGIYKFNATPLTESF